MYKIFQKILRISTIASFLQVLCTISIEYSLVDISFT